jgi:hypothetical protein
MVIPDPQVCPYKEKRKNPPDYTTACQTGQWGQGAGGVRLALCGERYVGGRKKSHCLSVAS